MGKIPEKELKEMLMEEGIIFLSCVIVIGLFVLILELLTSSNPI